MSDESLERIGALIDLKLSSFNSLLSSAPTSAAPARPGTPYHIDQPFAFWMTTSPKRLPGKQYTTDQLRYYADTFDPLRSIIEYLKGEAASIPIEFRARDNGDGQEAGVKFLTDWCGDNGPLGGELTRRVFEAKLFDDALVIGAYAAWYQRDRLGRPLMVDTLDASTIKPNIDVLGWPNPEIPYEQWVMGVQVCQFAPGDVRMDGLIPKTQSPYFTSPIELAMGRVLSGIRLDAWNDVWLDSSSARAGDVFTLPEWPLEKVQEFTMWFNERMRDPASRQSTIFVPGGTSKISDPTRKDQDFGAYEIQIIRRLCSLFGVMPASIGYVGEQYKVTQGDSMDASRRVGLGKLLALRKEFYDDLACRLGFPGVECINVEDDLDEVEQQARINTIECGGAYRTVNEVRISRGLEPIEGGDTLAGKATDPQADTTDSQDEMAEEDA